MQICFRGFFCYRDKVLWLVDEKLLNLKTEKKTLNSKTRVYWNLLLIWSEAQEEDIPG